MLVRFSVENFLSFLGRQELSMVKGPGRIHPDHVIPQALRHAPKLLKTAVIYGANASGKSNLVKAIDTARRLVLQGTRANQRINVTPFKLSNSSPSEPSRFEFEITVGPRSYAYGFSASATRVHEEWLYQIGLSGTGERKIFERQPDSGDIDFSGVRIESSEEREFLKFVGKGTRPNNLFLSECKERNVRGNVSSVPGIFEVLDWFEERLRVVFPNSQFLALEETLGKAPESRNRLSRLLKAFDTGIKELDLEELALDKVETIPAQLRELLSKEEGDDFILSTSALDRYRVKRGADGNLQVYRVVVKHPYSDASQKTAIFQLREESEGTRRLLDLSPGIIGLVETNLVWVVDELDRSLHPDITASLLKNFIAYSQRQSQLIFTTHEVSAFTQELLRRDEIWLVEKQKDQSSHLYSVQEFRLRADKDLRKAYLRGRFGAVPILSDFSWLGESRSAKGKTPVQT